MDKKLMLAWLQNQKPQITGINMLSRNLNEIAVNRVTTRTSGLPNQSLIDAAAKITGEAREKEAKAKAIADERARRKQGLKETASSGEDEQINEVTNPLVGGGVYITAPLTITAQSKLKLDEATEAAARRAAQLFAKRKAAVFNAREAGVDTSGATDKLRAAARRLNATTLRRAGAVSRRTGSGSAEYPTVGSAEYPIVPSVQNTGRVELIHKQIKPTGPIPDTTEARRTRDRLLSTDLRLTPDALASRTVPSGFNARSNMTGMRRYRDASGREEFTPDSRFPKKVDQAYERLSLPYVSTAGNNRLRNSIRPQASPSVFSRLAGAVKQGIGSVVGRFSGTNPPSPTPNTESPPSARTTQKRLAGLKTALKARVGRGGEKPSSGFVKLTRTEGEINSEENNRRARNALAATRAENERRNAAHLNTGRQGADE